MSEDQPQISRVPGKDHRTDELFEEAAHVYGRGDLHEMEDMISVLEEHLLHLKGYSEQDGSYLDVLVQTLGSADIPLHKRAGFLDSAVARLRASSGSLSGYARERISDFSDSFLSSNRRGERQKPAFAHRESDACSKIRNAIKELEAKASIARAIHGVQSHIRGAMQSVLGGVA